MQKGTSNIVLPRCTAQSPTGKFCDAPSLPDAPFPMCSRHARLAFIFGSNLVKQSEGSLDVIERFVGVSRTDEKPARERHEMIYFLELGGLIKIGYTSNWGTRKISYPPHAKILLLHRTKDAWSLEKRLHSQFRKHLRAGQEWFEPAPEILAYIDGLREAAA